MLIEFGWSLDGAAWADGTGTTGSVRLGPRGLVQLLQSRLALTRPSVDPAVRIAQYAKAIAEAEHPWPRESFAVDPWATAATMLSWRDAAVMAGAALYPRAGLPSRVEALCAIEEVASLSPGAADDLQELVALLEESPWPLGIERLQCHEEPEALPGLWPRLLALLGEGGVEVTAVE